MTVNEALKWAEERLTVLKAPDARAEAEFLLTHLLACKRHELFLNSRRVLSDAEEEVFLGYVERKANREPSQYIVGEAEFFGLGFKVTKDTLIPRPETELLVEEALSASKSFSADGELMVIDLCTGSGCVAITVANELPECMVYATDISNGALAIARENAIRNNVDSRVKFLEGDLFGPLEGMGLEGKAQMVLSNPPYVPLTEREKLEPEVRDYEPHAALFGGEDGLAFYRRIIREAPSYLMKGGCLILEIGWGQANEITGLLKAEKYGDIFVRKDYAGIERVVRARVREVSMLA